MKCGHCGHDNSPAAKFCENCGQPLVRRCPNCGEQVSPTARFCSNCGYNLAGAAGLAAAPPALTAWPGAAPPALPTAEQLRQAAPTALQEKIRSARGELEGERKLVTALFTDIVGSTEHAEALDPEDWREIVSGAHRLVGEAVHRYDGYIAQLLGDGVLAFFGAPVVHEDDAERAVRAALEVLAAIRGYAAQLRKRRLKHDFQMRVGLNTGTVVVGNIGTDLHMEYLAIGDTVNLAARMQSAADPDTVIISENTRRHLGSLFDLEDRGRITVKGKAEPVHVYRVVGERKGAARTRGIAGLSSPLVGREREFAALMQVSAELRGGRGGIVSIVGEAGLGKSRLVAEWRKVRGDDITWVEGRCLSYGAAVAYHLGIDVLRRLAGLSDDTAAEDARAALRRNCAELLGPRLMEVYPYLAHLLGVPLEDDLVERVRYLDAAALQAHYAAAYKAYLRARAAYAPLVVVADDVHWADPSSAELGSQVLPVAADAPVVFVFLSRPDQESPGWRLISAAREVPGVSALELHLAPLTESDSRQLVDNLLTVAELPARVRSLILGKSEGNPFYVEEVIRMLIDHGVLQRVGERWIVTRDISEIEIPDTLQGVIMARIDRLPEEARRTLQIASVIGRRFPLKVLESVMAGMEQEHAGAR
jgi:class 3 adenylate cyclase